ncbi:hypothetical protein [Streptomyces daliensis]|uniref:Uncharacterized protein n=1 Tax=Streptomyces daliensis TaxID=299421 RepID=A0A8T4ITW0_9ACTN|nr:hypothetical protein [Streptomyces daliensis]
MGKNKNRNRQQQREDESRSAAEQVHEGMKRSTGGDSRAQSGTTDAPRKHQRRFGHN